MVCVLLSASGGILAQSVTRLDLPKPQGNLTGAFLTYPPIAVAARVSGDVKLKVHLRADGIPSDVSVMNGPQMLRAVSIEGAEKNAYVCRSCTESGADVDLTYAFKLGPAIGCGEGGVDSTYPRFTHSGDRITIEAQPYLICDPAAEVTRVPARSGKCLFLWHCGWR
jgi:Gram-negative bacterial TonB protein C-terminal